MLYYIKVCYFLDRIHYELCIHNIIEREKHDKLRKRDLLYFIISITLQLLFYALILLL